MGPEFGSELEIPKKVILAIEEVGAARPPVLFAPLEVQPRHPIAKIRARGGI